MKPHSIDRKLFFMTAILVAFGYLIFSSASLGLLARSDANFGSIALKQALVGVLGGAIVLIALANINYKIWRKWSLYILIIGIAMNFLIFIPGLALYHGGATRWLSLGIFSFQPAELLRVAAVMYYAAWLASMKKQIETFTYGFVPLLVICMVIEGITLLQHDTDPIIIMALVGMFFVAGGKIKHILLMGLVGICALGIIVLARPYVLGRILTFIDPSRDALGASYQTQQALIAVGTGGVFGRGFGQSIQKFNFLPEPIGDSIFAVAAEEFGFVGASLLIILFAVFTLKTLKIASETKDTFGSTMIVGFTILMIGQSFINIGAMVGILPLTGVPLVFVSQGGTAMLVGLAEVGIILNISKYRKSS